MNESILTRSPGTLSIPGSANARGVLQLGETSACFVNRKGEELVAFSYHDIVRLKNVRNGGVSSTITVTLNDDSAFDMHLKSGLACHSFIDKHWPNKPRQVKRQPVYKRHRGRKGVSAFFSLPVCPLRSFFSRNGAFFPHPYGAQLHRRRSLEGSR